MTYWDDIREFLDLSEHLPIQMDCSQYVILKRERARKALDRLESVVTEKSQYVGTLMNPEPEPEADKK